MKKIVTIILLNAAFYLQSAAQTNIDSMYTAMAEAIDQQHYQDALLAANAISNAEKKFNANVELVKVNCLKTLANINEAKDPYFVQLDNTLDYIIKNTKYTNVKDLPLYLEHYEMFFQLKDYIRFVKLKRSWLEDPNFQEGLKNYKIKNYGVAKTYFDKGYVNNNAASYLFLGLIYENGLGVKEDFNKAYEHYNKSYHIGNYDAAYHIGYCYFYGLGVTKNIIQGYNWCKLAADYNYAQAMAELSNRYEKGLLVEQNEEQAAYWKNRSMQANTFSYYSPE